MRSYHVVVVGGCPETHSILRIVLATKHCQVRFPDNDTWATVRNPQLRLVVGIGLTPEHRLQLYRAVRATNHKTRMVWTRERGSVPERDWIALILHGLKSRSHVTLMPVGIDGPTPHMEATPCIA